MLYNILLLELPLGTMELIEIRTALKVDLNKLAKELVAYTGFKLTQSLFHTQNDSGLE